MERILIIEDEEKILGLLTDYLQLQGFEVLRAMDGETGLALYNAHAPDLVILDIMLPGLDGYGVLEKIKEKANHPPVLMLTAKGEETDKLKGFDLGAEDYVTKPFSIKELHARVKVLLRRTKKEEEEIERYTFDDVAVDFKRFEISKQGNPVKFSSMEFKVLKYFILHKGEVITRETLLDEVWGYNVYPTTRTVDTHILNMRKKLENNPNEPKYLITVHGVGYKFVE